LNMLFVEPTPSQPVQQPVGKVTPVPQGALRVVVTHEFGLPWVTLEYEGKTEDLEHADAIEWFKQRGAKDLEKVNAAINEAFNFFRVEVIISEPIKPGHKPGEPQV
jgi:hydroxymethylglutaryl-CoA reductase